MTRRAKPSLERYTENNPSSWEDLKAGIPDTEVPQKTTENGAPKSKKKKKAKLSQNTDSSTINEETSPTELKPKKKKLKRKAEKDTTSEPNSEERLKKEKRKKKKKKMVNEDASADEAAAPEDPMKEDEGENGIPPLPYSVSPGTVKVQGKIELPISDEEIRAQRDFKSLTVLLAKYKEKGELSEEAERIVLKRWKKNTNKACFNCRQLGHKLSECPDVTKDVETGYDICFKCGSTEHKSRACKAKVEGFPFAKCFVCKSQGHLARNCSKNTKGIFPYGGSCNECGDKSHLAVDCPTLAKTTTTTPTEQKLTTWKGGVHVSVDEEENVALEGESPKKKKAKVVKF